MALAEGGRLWQGRAGMARGGFFSVDSLRGVHVLVVDDDADSRDLFAAILQYCGALVTTVGSADAALKVMAVARPDVIVADLVMPDKDGYWLLRRVRSLKPDEGGVVPVIAVSAGAAPAASEPTPGPGFAGFLAKPVDPWDLCRLVANLTNANWSG